VNYAIKIIQKNGAEDFLCDGLTTRPTKFPSRAAAERQRDFMNTGMEGDVQSINVVPYPKEAKK
jgi:hypothetical protein